MRNARDHDAPERTETVSDSREYSPRELVAWREPFLIPLGLLLISRLWLWSQLHFASEDAYITYRYARNLAIGLGLVFNPGEKVMGFTSPLWTVWNALGWKLMRDPANWSRGWSVLADVVTLIVVAALLRRHVSRASAWVFAFLFAAWTLFAAVTASGMEISAMLALVALGAMLAGRGSIATGPVLGALALMRPEGVFAAAVIALGAKWRDRLIALAIAAAGFGALYLYFGTIVPQSLTAKAQLYGTPGPWAGRHWWEWIVPFSLGRWPEVPEARFVYLTTILGAPAAFVGAMRLWKLRRTEIATLAGALLIVWAGYAALGVAYFFWYLEIPLACWFLLIALGFPEIVRHRAVYVSAALFVLGTWTVIWELYGGRARLERNFALVADHLLQHSQAWDKVMLEPIGLVGYYARVTVLDEVGLVSPRIAKRRMGGPGWASDVIEAEQPQWIVMRRGELTSLQAFAGRGAPFRSAAERDSVLAPYAEDKVVPGEDEGGALVVMKRRR